MSKYRNSELEASTIKGIIGSVFLVIVQIAFIVMKVFKIWKFATASMFVVLLPIEFFLALLVIMGIMMLALEMR